MQIALEEEQRARDDARMQYENAERRANELNGQLIEAKQLIEQCDRARRSLEADLATLRDQVNDMSASSASLTMAKRKLEGDIVALQTDLDEMMSEYKMAEDKAKKAMLDAARLVDELRAEQANGQVTDNARRATEAHMKELQSRLEEAETAALRGGKKMIEKLEQKCRQLETELEMEQRRHADASKNARRGERKSRELSFQSDEDKKNQERMQELVDKLQQKLVGYKRQIEQAEEIAAMNLAKYRKSQQELEDAEERVNISEQAVAKLRAGARSFSVARE